MGKKKYCIFIYEDWYDDWRLKTEFSHCNSCSRLSCLSFSCASWPVNSLTLFSSSCILCCCFVIRLLISSPLSLKVRIVCSSAAFRDDWTTQKESIIFQRSSKSRAGEEKWWVLRKWWVMHRKWWVMRA